MTEIVEVIPEPPPFKKKGCDYLTIRPMLKTLDLIFFKGNDFVSKSIMGIESRCTGIGTYSHVGLVLRGTSFPRGHRFYSNYRIYILESVMSGRTNGGVFAMDGKPHFGVQLRDLDEVVKYYDMAMDTELGWGGLLPRLITNKMLVEQILNETDQGREFLSKIFENYNGTAYDSSIIDLISATNGCCSCCCREIRDSSYFEENYTRRGCFGKICCCCFRKIAGLDDRSPLSPSGNIRDKVERRLNPRRGLFCSELVASVYKDIEIFPSDIIPGNVLPVDFIQSKRDSHKTVDADNKIPLVISEVMKFTVYPIE